MNSRYLKAAALAAATICSSNILHAAPITYNFTATDFSSYYGAAVPVGSIAGSFTVDGTTVTQFDLTIGSHTYSAADVAIYDEYPIVAGTLTNEWITAGTDDFWLQWFQGEPTHFSNFAYAVAGTSDFFTTTTGTISAVPVPAAAWLLGSGLMGLAGLARRAQLSV